MRVRVRLFGALAERAGREEEHLDLPDGATGADILRAVGEHHPAVAPFLDRVSVAVNLEVVPPDRRVGHGDEVALLPPVAGGAARIRVALVERPSVDEALDAVASPDAGGTVAFLGTVRAEGGAVDRLEYSAYRAMAERVLREIAGEAAAKWSLEGVAILHAVGDLAVGDPTVAVAYSAAHRGEAFDACRYAIGEVKRRLPVWKREVGAGGSRWVGLQEHGSDEDRRASP